MTEVQAGLLELLKEIDDICTKHDIEYYLAGGTFIGAVRHHGFLPWDDDADIHMTRENLEKLISCQDDFLPGREIVSKFNYEEFPMIHFRYMNCNQTTLLRSTFMTESPQGQFIDIIVLDPIPNDTSMHPDIIEKYNLYLEFKSNVFVNDSRRSEEFFVKYAQLKKEQEEIGHKAVVKRLEDELYQYEEEGNDYYLIRSIGVATPILPKHIWGKPKRIPFENMMLPVACEPEQVLMMAYGDRWIDVPPVKERGTHMFVVDRDFPYRIYEKEYTRYLDKKEFLEHQGAKKEKWFEFVADRNYVNKRINQLLAYSEMIKIDQNIENHNIALKELIEQEEYAQIYSIFAGYYRVQFTRFKYYNNYFEMPDAYLWAALYPLVMEGDYNKLLKVVALRERSNRSELSDELSEMKQLCEACVTITNCIYVYAEYKKASKLISKWIDKYPKMITLCRADICVALLLGKELDLAFDRLQRYLKSAPNDGELLKYYADFMMLQGREEKAIRYYKRAYSTVTNGLLQTEIMDILQKYSEK